MVEVEFYERCTIVRIRGAGSLETITKIGLGFLVFWFLLSVVSIVLAVMFLVGSSGNPPLSSTPQGRLVADILTLGRYAYAFLIAGVVLIGAGLLQRRRSRRP